MHVYICLSIFNALGVETVLDETEGRARLEKATRATRMIFLMSGLAMASWAPMVPYAKARLHLDDADLGLVLLAFGGGSMLSMPVIGWLASRYGNRRVIGFAGALMCLALPILTLVPTTALLAVGLLYFGAMLGAVDVAMNAHAVDVERLAGRAVMSGFHGLFSLGGLAGAAAMSAMLASGLPWSAPRTIHPSGLHSFFDSRVVCCCWWARFALSAFWRKARCSTGVRCCCGIFMVTARPLPASVTRAFRWPWRLVGSAGIV